MENGTWKNSTNMNFTSSLISSNKLLVIRLAVRNLCFKNFSAYRSNTVDHKKEIVRVDKNTLALLERLSLVKCDSPEGLKVLKDSIAFANRILDINTDNVEPLYSVLENENLFLRNDIVTQGDCQKDILKNASLKEDDYFVTPPGNIPLHEINVENKE